jgi:hypothetical protein
VRLLVAPGEHDGADEGGEQQDADRLERQDVVPEDGVAERLGGGGGAVGDALAAPGVAQVSMANTPPPMTSSPTRARGLLSSTRRPTGARVSMMPNRISTTIAPT